MLNILPAIVKVANFISKLQIYPRSAEADDLSMWLELTNLLESSKQKCSFALSVTESISRCFSRTEQRDMNVWM
jgi:hypothetical protein